MPAKVKKGRRVPTMAEIERQRGVVCSAAIAFDAAWKNKSLHDEGVWEAANKVAHTAKRLWHMSIRYAKAYAKAHPAPSSKSKKGKP